MITCLIRYTLCPTKRAEFIEYSKSWEHLIKKHGGLVHGFFLPLDHEKPKVPLSFSSIGRVGDENIAVALFSFSSTEEYTKYIAEVKEDSESQKVIQKFKEQPFISYERTFLTPISHL